MNTIQENNKLIAEFIGETKQPFEFPEFGYINVMGEWKDTFFVNQLKFHKDWNWLMEIVQKINDQNNVVQIHENHVMVVNNTKGEILVDVVSGSMLEATYDAVVEYIKLKK